MFFKNQLLGYLCLFILFLSLFWFLFRLYKLYKLDKLYKLLNLFLIFSFIMLFFYKNSLIDFYLLFLIPIVIIYFVLIFKKTVGEKIAIIIFFLLILINLFKSPAFGAYDRTFLWIRESIKKITNQKQYCINYSIFPQNFIESKYRYMITLAENKPVYDNCDLAMYYRCDPKVKKGYYLCETAICPRAPIDLSWGKIIDMNPFGSDVKIYEFEY